MSIQADPDELPPVKRRRLIGLGVLRALVTTTVLVALYYLLPLDHIDNVPVALVAGLLILAAVTVFQLRTVIRARYPSVRAIEALATTVPLFLLLFASAYLTMAHTHPANFNTHPLTRTDTLYFTVTVFSTVGFGDIAAVSQSARLVVTVQMLLDLLALGLVVRAFVGAVQLARQQSAADPGVPPGQRPPAGDNTGLSDLTPQFNAVQRRTLKTNQARRSSPNRPTAAPRAADAIGLCGPPRFKSPVPASRRPGLSTQGRG